jgi:DNA repair protein RadA/Sms
LGKCPQCGAWNSLVETVVSTEREGKRVKEYQRNGSSAKLVKLSEIKSGATKRISTKISELDRVLGGGLVPGQVVLIAGEPGIGKSTLLTQVADKLSDCSLQTTAEQKAVVGSPSSVLYVCGEESANQIAVRAKRLEVNSKNIQLLEDTDVDSVINTISTFKGHALQGVIVDSIQTMTTSDLSGMAGSVGQVRECAFRLLKAAKERNIPLFLVGHVTKEGTVAGPAVLAHVVDTVLWFEGDKTLTTRVLRAVKNRFGPTDEVGVFQMEDKGLIPVGNIERAFLEKNQKSVSGSVVTSVMQGTRPILVEIQALVVPTKLAIPRRVAQGIDSRRLELLLAVLTRRCGLPVYEYDVFVNVAGGLKVTEPASDLAICLAVASSYFDKPISSKTIAVGEVGLLGEIREVVAQEKRLREAGRMGFNIPVSSKESKFVGQAIKALFK